VPQACVRSRRAVVLLYWYLLYWYLPCTGKKVHILTLRAAGVRALAPWSKDALDQLKKWSEKTETKRFRGNCDSKVGAKEVKAAQKAVIEAKYAADIASAAAHAAGAQFYHFFFFYLLY
jgi:hypothetical protein